MVRTLASQAGNPGSNLGGRTIQISPQNTNPQTANRFSETKKPMPLYILLSNLTDEGWKTVRSRPERIKEVNKELEAFGVKVLKQYATLGTYDFVNIVEAPDNKTVAKVSIELGSRGTIQISTMPAIPIDEFISSIAK